VKIKIWQCEAQKVGLALEVHFLAADGERDVAVLGSIDVTGLEALDEGYCLGDAPLEIGEARFLVGIARGFGPSESRRGALGEVRGNLHLAGEGKHIGCKTPIEQDALFYVALLGQGLGPFQNGREIV
jgi:hypothetical protein